MDDLPDDLLRILPSPSRAKLEALLIERDAARAAYVAASDAWQAARQEHGLLEARVQQQLSQFQGYEVLAPGEAFLRGSVEAAKSEAEERLMGPVVASKRRLDLAAAAMERAAERQASFGYLENIQQWLSRIVSLGAPRFEHFAPPPPKVRDPLAEIQKLRDQLSELDAAWTAAENAPCPADELRARFLSELDAIAERGRPSVDATARAGSPVNLAAALRIGQMPVGLADGGTHFSLVGDAGASFFVWMMRDEIAARISKMIEAAPQEGALDDDARDREFSRISARRLELERQEEALIVAAERDGRAIQRRRDADPRAILEVVEA